MDVRIALAGNPNCGKTTLFNALTSSNQFVGNWPGVTVEKKEGKLKKHDGVIITDLPGIYSLSPYTLEEVVARNYLISERPDAVINVIDGTNLERNLYLTTQLTELGIPVVAAVNMMDVVEKNGDEINTAELSRALGCKVVEISALKGSGIMEAAEAAIDAAKSGKTVPMHTFSGTVEHALAHIEEAVVHNMPEEQQRWYAVKLFERDDKVQEQMKLDASILAHIETDIRAAEEEMDDDAESIITNERYLYISGIIKGCLKKKSAGKLTNSDNRVFRKFGLSGKSFIPMLIGTGCGIPGIMASRTIENERDRRMTIMTTTFIPCGAKVPFISMVAGAVFGGSAWVATSAYFVGMAAIIVSGIMLKKTKMFSGDPAPFVMELPAYHMPTVGNVLRSMWERGWSFIKKAGTIILLSTIAIWFMTYFGFTSEGFRMLAEEEMDQSLLAVLGGAIAWIFLPLGWGNWQAAVASITGLVAKENIVGTMGILYPGGWPEIGANFSTAAGYSFLVFNLLCAPCFAAIGAIKREMNNAKWTWFAIGYQCGFAYAAALMVYQIGSAFNGNFHVFGLAGAIVIFGGMLYMLFRPYQEARKLTADAKLKIAKCGHSSH